MSVMGVPIMTKSSFVNTEKAIGEVWKQELLKSMADTGAEEKWLAIERGEYHEGIPAITVIVDGGWSKRSHKHSYNANSGVGIILGKETGRLLYLGVRNKYRSACAQGIPQDVFLIGLLPPPKWRRTSFWRGFWRLSGYMEFGV